MNDPQRRSLGTPSPPEGNEDKPTLRPEQFTRAIVQLTSPTPMQSSKPLEIPALTELLMPDSDLVSPPDYADLIESCPL